MWRVCDWCHAPVPYPLRHCPECGRDIISYRWQPANPERAGEVRKRIREMLAGRELGERP